jgi:hypothetical protein
MKTSLSLFTLALVLTLAACGGNDTSATTVGSNDSTPAAAAAPTTTLTPEQLGELGAKIRKEPSRGDELLQQHGLNRESFEKAIRDVTQNADASKRYAEAYRKASA